MTAGLVAELDEVFSNHDRPTEKGQGSIDGKFTTAQEGRIHPEDVPEASSTVEKYITTKQ